VADSAPLLRTFTAKTHFGPLVHRKYNTIHRRQTELLIVTGLKQTCQDPVGSYTKEQHKGKRHPKMPDGQLKPNSDSTDNISITIKYVNA
jgi:hypothetical protein